MRRPRYVCLHLFPFLTDWLCVSPPGVLNEERLKHGNGVYTWKKAGEEGEEPVTKATYEGEYVNGQKEGLGKFTYPNGDVYHGQVCM